MLVLCVFRVQPNCQDVNGETPLHLAALNGHRFMSLSVDTAYNSACVYSVLSRKASYVFVYAVREVILTTKFLTF